MAMARLIDIKTILLLGLILLSGVAKIECGLRGRILDEDKGDLGDSGGPASDPADDAEPSDGPAGDSKASDGPAGESSDGPASAPSGAVEPSDGPASDVEPSDGPAGDVKSGVVPLAADAKASGGSGVVFDVTKYGAKGDGKKDNTQAFMQAWIAACKAGPATVLVPKGNFVLSPVVFQGPCKGTITVQVAGIVIATTDLSEYSEDAWILFEKVNGVVLTGGGTFDGKGASAWPYNNCKKGGDCNMPTSIKFIHVTNAVVHHIKSVDSKFFHFHVTDCSGFKAYNLTIVAPAESPNTDGIHLSDTDKISITNSHIGTGDDCISIGQGVVGCEISNIFCGPGHGISIGSLGKRPNEAALNGVTVTDCTLANTDNGVRIKTFSGSPPGNAAGIHFTNIVLDNVKNPIIIDQFYGSKGKGGSPSRVKVTDVIFKNIRGTSTSNVAVSLLCSSAFPCPVQMEDIDLALKGGSKAQSECSNAKVTYKGKQNPTPCK